jgi:uncharacterized membrane protein (GlpM family)
MPLTPSPRAAASKREPMRQAVAWLKTAVPWKFFLGACLLTGALLFPHANAGPVIAGMILAGAILMLWTRFRGR